MNDDQRLLIAVPYLLMVVIGLLAIILPMWARTLGILGAVTGASGLVWTCWGSGIAGWVFRRLRRGRSSFGHPPLEVKVEAKPPMPAATTTGEPLDEYLVLGVPCEPEIYEEMKRAVADGWRLARVPGLEKPRD